MSKINYPALTGVRAIAAFMVYIHHFGLPSFILLNTKAINFFEEFHVSLTIFFVLSGFLICNRYYDEIDFNFKKFLVKRFARVYPVYFILTTFTFIVSLFSVSKMSIQVYILNITFLRGLFDDYKFSCIDQGWSLTVEEMFYIISPFFFILIKQKKIFLIAIPIIVVSLGYLSVFVLSDLNFYGLMKNTDFMLDFTFFGRITEFICGIFLSVYFKKIKEINIFKFNTYFGVFIIFLGIYCLSLLKVGNGSGTDSLFGKLINTLLIPLFGIVPFFYGLITENTIVSKILSSKFFQILGKSSYVFYLIHMGFFYTFFNNISTNYFFVLIMLILLSIFLYLLVEKPLNKFIRNQL